jgi:hypothetical protein
LSKRIVSVIVSTLLLISVFSIAFNIYPVESEAQTITVPDDYPTIQEAIDAANPGDTIFVRNGSYDGPIVVNKGVKLVGESRQSTVTTNVEIIADNVTVTGFTVSAWSSLYSGVGIGASNVKGINVSGNFMQGGQWSGSGLGLTSVSNSTFSGNSIHAGEGRFGDLWGFSMNLSSFNTFLGNNFSSCKIVSSSNNIFSGNHITGDSYRWNHWSLDISNSTNNWNATYPLGGNYWSGYAGVDLKKGLNQDQPGGDGIGDTPYIINEDDIDHYPLMRPYAHFTAGAPFANFEYTPNKLAGENVTFDASASVDLNGNIVEYAWDFGDGASATSASPVISHAYGSVWSHAVKLTVTDDNGLTDTSTQSVTVGIVPTSISIGTSASSMFAGFKVDVSGTLRDVYGNGLIGKTVVLSYSFSGIDTWDPITSCTTDDLGNYAATWIPTATGAFTLKATWSGTDTVSAAASNTTLTCLSYEEYVFSVESNSTITGLTFNAADQNLSFTATGADGTKGYVRATVAKSLASNPAGIKVLIDGTQIACSPTSTSDSSLIYFTYQHSTHNVLIDLSAAVAEPTPTPTPSSTATPTPTPATSATPQPTATPTPTVSPTATPQPDETPLTNWLLILLIAVVITAVFIAVILAWKRKKRPNPQTA